MLPEVGATELLVIAAIALIVVGPKDLPVMLRKLGQFLARLRAMANDFRASFDEMARQSELDELRREVEAMRAGRYYDPATLADVEADQVFADIHAELTGKSAPVIEAAPEPAPKPKRKAPARKKTASATAAKKPRVRKKPEAKA
jgi:sec-independent protein translocase protein TatB